MIANEQVIPNPVTQSSRTPGKVFMYLLRRLHLYFGLFLFPWAILYGVTSFLFNHPTAFSDQNATQFGKSAITGTQLESLPTPQSMAENVVNKLNELQKPEVPYTLAGPAKFNREFAFGTMKSEEQSLSFLVDPRNGIGNIRTAPPERKPTEKAPFAVGNPGGPVGGKGRGMREGSGEGREGSRDRNDMTQSQESIKLDNPIHEQIKAAMPTVFKRTGYAKGDITITSVPEVVFPIKVNDRIWTANYNPMTGNVTGVPQDTKPENEVGWRRFLLRLHTAHGYPGETNGRWFWAVIVDVMAFTMCFWGLSGLVMWWQIKSTRKLGTIILILSAIAATVLGWLMYLAITG